MTKCFSGPPASSMNVSLMPEPLRLPPPTMRKIRGAVSGASLGRMLPGRSDVAARPRRGRRPKQRQGRAKKNGAPMNYLFEEGGTMSFDAEIGDQVPVVLVVVANLADERIGARDLRRCRTGSRTIWPSCRVGGRRCRAPSQWAMASLVTFTIAALVVAALEGLLGERAVSPFAAAQNM